MSDHNSAVFNNTCLKIPRDPISQHPSPSYEQKYISQMENQSRKMDLNIKNHSIKSSSSLQSNKSVLKSLIEFYDSIPEYDDINHLSNKDFYKKLDHLKERQRRLYEFVQDTKYELNSTSCIDDYKNLNIKDKMKDMVCPKSAIKQFCDLSTLNKIASRREKQLDDLESISSFDKETTGKPPSRRSVRIESPSDKSNSPTLYNLRTKSRTNVSSAESKGNEKSSESYSVYAGDDLSFNDFRFDIEGEMPLITRSAPNSPIKGKIGIGWNENGITIPKPFKMTVRDEENKIVDEVMLNTQKIKETNSEMFRANPVPIESRIPLFNKVIADQERRSEIVKRKSKETLKAQMRPFSFTRREEKIQALTKNLSKSSPSILLDDISENVKQFKAKPIPRGLFSNFVYQKMHEDEFYRALQRKIRAEEMLRRSSLPPSMAKREKTKPPYVVCPRSFKSLEESNEMNSFIKSPTIPNYKALHDRLEKELHQLKNDFITTSPIPIKLKTAKRSAERKLKKCYGSSRNSSDNSGNVENYRATSAADLLSINKSNLAAVLRIQSAKKRMQMEMCKKLEEAKLREEARWREKVLRRKPAWQSLAYSHEEDLAMRLRLRKDEERLRNEEHRHRMELMFGRVYKMPMLFERQSQYKQYPITKEELISKLHDDYLNGDKYSNEYSDLSPLSSRNTSRKCLDAKDNENKALTEELYDNEEKTDKSNAL